MKHAIFLQAPKADAYVIAYFSNAFPRQHPILDLFSSLDKKYATALSKKLTGEGEFTIALLPDAQKKVCLLCLGQRDMWGFRRLRLAVRKIFQALKGAHCAEIALHVDDFTTTRQSLETIAETIASNAEMAVYEFVSYRSAPKEGWNAIESVSYGIKDSARKRAIQRAVETGAIIGQEVNAARELANTPGGDMTPRLLAQAAKRRGAHCGFTVKVIGEAEMKKMGMGGILGVSCGSKEEAQLIVCEYRNAAASKKPYVFVGKGITFDTGGINLKPTAGMDEMHMDMSGGAAVISALAALSRMKAKANIIGIIAAAENMPSGESYRPGDVLKMMSGTTVEVANTDAEGRIVVADALTYATRYEPSIVLDVATLTGACCVALGRHAFAILSPDEEFASRLGNLGESSGDYAWPLPMWAEYEADVKGTVGDIANALKSRDAGAINGGMFLYQFAKKFPRWAHLDIASTMVTSSDQYLSKGASGSGTRLLIEVGRNYGRV